MQMKYNWYIAPWNARSYLSTVLRIYKQVLTIPDKMFILEMATQNLWISPNRFIYKNKNTLFPVYG
jgi:hypothetical protein